MALRVQTQISGDVFIFLCDGRIVYGDEGAVLRERIGSILKGSQKIVINLHGVDYIDSGGLGILVALLVSARNRGGELNLMCIVPVAANLTDGAGAVFALRHGPSV